MAYSTIPKGSLYMNTKLYTGNGSTNNITGVGFQPDWVWLKSRSVADSHILFDSVRGVTKRIMSNSSSAESTQAQEVQSFDSDGFTVGNSDNANRSGATMVAWNWLANGAGSANTDGSISSTVSANTTSGFSIVSYNGNGSNGSSVGHGLGAVPQMLITKRLNSADPWIVQQHQISATPWDDNYCVLDTTAAKAGTLSVSGGYAPNANEFYVGAASAVNGSTSSYITYCFTGKQGFSKFGGYTGNGNADGTFVYTGFKPAFVITKGTANISSWSMTDSTISTFNDGSLEFLKANEADAESSRSNYDILSNGFKMRTTDADYNGSGNNYIYMAFAENPFVATSGTNAIPVTAR